MQGTDSALGNPLFDAVKLTKNTDPNNCSYFGYGIRFNVRGIFSLSDGSGFNKNVITFGTHMRSPVHFDNKKKNVLIISKGLAHGLVDPIFISEKEYSIKCSKK